MSSFLLNKKESQFILTEIELPTLPQKIYGDVDLITNKVLTTFKDRPKNTGALFSGLKGNSKTLCCVSICSHSGYDSIMITDPFTGDDFKAFISSLKKETIIFIDEFEKVYDTTELQEEFLSILDGVMDTKILFLFTSNSHNISQFLLNRPSRIFYHFKFDNLEESVIDEIIGVELKEKQFETDLRDIITTLGAISFDVLLNLIEEINRFKTSPKTLIKHLNVRVEQTNFSVVLLVDGKRYTSKVDFNPLMVESMFIPYTDDKGRYKYFSDYTKNFTMYSSKGTFIFESENVKLFFTPYKPYKFEL